MIAILSLLLYLSLMTLQMSNSFVYFYLFGREAAFHHRSLPFLWSMLYSVKSRSAWWKFSSEHLRAALRFFPPCGAHGRDRPPHTGGSVRDSRTVLALGLARSRCCCCGIAFSDGFPSSLVSARAMKPPILGSGAPGVAGSFSVFSNRSGAMHRGLTL
uniref:Putative secreted protein n=1 Tax=Anopheles darlingi TaxID=43151 RepID=A0A2M4DIC5_ANODA